jgi:hypothetical protein
MVHLIVAGDSAIVIWVFMCRYLSADNEERIVTFRKGDDAQRRVAASALLPILPPRVQELTSVG